VVPLFSASGQDFDLGSDSVSITCLSTKAEGYPMLSRSLIAENQGCFTEPGKNCVNPAVAIEISESAASMQTCRTSKCGLEFLTA
jgi:hypothetical protein